MQNNTNENVFAVLPTHSSPSFPSLSQLAFKPQLQTSYSSDGSLSWPSFNGMGLYTCIIVGRWQRGCSAGVSRAVGPRIARSSYRSACRSANRLRRTGQRGELPAEVDEEVVFSPRQEFAGGGGVLTTEWGRCTPTSTSRWREAVAGQKNPERVTSRKEPQVGNS